MKLQRNVSSQRDFTASLAVVLLLSFGLGAASLLYTALDRLLLHPLSVAHQKELVRAAEKRPPTISWGWFPYSTYEAMQQMRSFRDVAVEGDIDTVAIIHGTAQPVFAHMVSGSYFQLLGAAAEVGRTLEQTDERISEGNVPVVLSHHFWSKEFGNSPYVVGSTLIIQNHPFVIAGIMPKSFSGMTIDAGPDLWLPLSAQPVLSRKSLTDPEPDRHFSILARLGSGVSLAQAQAEFASVYKALQDAEKDPDPERQGILQPIAQGAFALHDQFARALSLLLWGLAALLLLMSANVAGLMLARAARRERDTAIRLALGASRASLIRRSLLHAAALGFAGACGGLLFAVCCAPLLASLLPAGRSSPPVSLFPDGKTAVLAFCLAVVLSFLFGVIPAWLSSRVAPQRALHGGASTRRPGFLSRGLLTFQTGLTFILLVETGLLLRTFYVLEHTDPGFDVEHLIAFTLDPGAAGMAAQRPENLPSDLLRSVRELPGVRDAGLTSSALMKRIGIKTSVAPAGQKIPLRAFLNTSLNNVSSTFFSTMGMPIVAGSDFSEADALRSHPTPVVINEAFARTFFPNENPIGKIFGHGAPGDIAAAENIVVGVAGDSKYRSLREAMLPIYYAPVQQRVDWSSEFYLYVRTQGPPATIVDAVRKTLARLDAQMPFYEIATMREQVSESLWQERLLAVLGMAFSAVSILMAAAGLYGLLSYDTSQRTREFGIRTAIGAQKRHVVFLLLNDVARILVPGVAAGFIACLLLGRWVAFALYGVRPLDPSSLLGAMLITASIAGIACAGPVWKAIHVDPAIVLRDE